MIFVRITVLSVFLRTKGKILLLLTLSFVKTNRESKRLSYLTVSTGRGRKAPAISCFLIAQNSVMKSGRGGKFFRKFL